MPKKKKPVFEVLRGGDCPEPIFTIPYNREEPLPANRVMFNNKFDKCEFVFQFDDDEPVVFATTGPTSFQQNLTITIQNAANGNLRFTHKDRTFTIFARKPELKNTI